ncbi:hypothetical protein OKA06_05945 [Novosphingobium sp. MW5]|nr:hypothetical protein [Novosphingobium sp. MW5]
MAIVSIRTASTPIWSIACRKSEIARVMALSPTIWPSQHEAIRSSRDSTLPGVSHRATRTRITRGSSISLRSPQLIRRAGGSIASGPSWNGAILARSRVPERD